MLRNIFLSFLLIFFSSNIFANQENPVRVRLLKGIDKLILSGFVDQVQNIKLNNRVEKQNLILQNWLIHYIPEKKSWSVSHMIKNQTVKEWKFSGSHLTLVGRELRKADFYFPGEIRLSGSSVGIDVVGYFDLEDYVEGVLGSEIPLSWPIEALKAQAIAARSYVLAVQKKRQKLSYDVENTIEDQVFKQIKNIVQNKKTTTQAIAHEAVMATKGLYIAERSGQFVKAYYHSDCGGMPSSEKNVWGYGTGVEYVSNHACPQQKTKSWSLKLSKNEIQRKVSRIVALRAQQKIVQVMPIKNNENERSYFIQIVLNDGSRRKISAHRFREVIGFDRLRSTNFEVVNHGSQYEFTGRGWGHGVGLCQWGALRLAESGQNAKAIIGFYYPNRSVQSL